MGYVEFVLNIITKSGQDTQVHYINDDWFRVQHNGMSPRRIFVQAAGNNDPEG